MTKIWPASLFFAWKLTDRQKSIAQNVVVLLFIAAGLAALGLTRSTAPVDETTAQVESERLNAMEVVAQESFERTLEFTGRVHSQRRTMASFQRGGLVIKLLANDGQLVEAGQPLAQLDARHLHSELQSLIAKQQQAMAILAELKKGPRQEVIDAARSDVSDLAAQLKGQQLRLDRSEKLMKTNAVPVQDYEQILYATNAMSAKLESAKSRLRELEAGTRPEQITAQQALVSSIEAEIQLVKNNIDDCQLVAPFSGMVLERQVDRGTVVEAGAAIFELIDHLDLEIHVGLPGRIARKLKVGQQLPLSLGPLPLTAEVRVVLPAIDQNTRTQKVILDFVDRGGPAAVSGQIVRVHVADEIAQSGFWIPATAIASDERGLWSCYTVAGHSRPEAKQTASGTLRKQSVEVLYQQRDRVFVRGTLQNGDWLIRDGLHRVVPGQRVQFALVSD